MLPVVAYQIAGEAKTAAKAQMPPDGVLDLGLANAILLRIIPRSCSPKTDAIWIIARPIGVVLSIACWSE